MNELKLDQNDTFSPLHAATRQTCAIVEVHAETNSGAAVHVFILFGG